MDRKIIITGTTCTGKTTLGAKLSRHLNIPQIDLDDLYFLPNWVEKERHIFINDVANAIKNKAEWIVSGSYQSVLKDSIWQEATHIVWLDYLLNLILRRYFIRTYRRIVLKEKCCGENYETLAKTFSKESLFLWIFKTYYKRKQRLKSWKNGMFSHKKWIVLTMTNEEKNLYKELL